MKSIVTTSITCLAIAVALGFGLIPALDRSASCAECESDNLPGIKKAFAAFDESCRKQLTDPKDQSKDCFVSNVYNKVLPIMKGLSKDNRFGPGDRVLFVGDTHNGNLLANTNRGFQSGTPLDKDSVTVEISKTDGGNGALVKICSVDEAGTLKRVGTIKFDENPETGKKTATVTGVQGKILRIDIASIGGSARKFQYMLKIS